MFGHLDWALLCVLADALWQVERLFGRVRRLESNGGALHEVVTVAVELKAAFFTEALKFSDQEIQASEQITRFIFLRLQVWDNHYSGEIAFKSASDEEPQRRERIALFPTSSHQFPLELARNVLFGKPEREHSRENFGPTAPEKLVVMLSHKAVIIRARDGRFGYDGSPSELLIPTRQKDLHDYQDTFGLDDPDFHRIVGLERRYEQNGRWASWTLTALKPVALSTTTGCLDSSPVQPRD